MQTETINVATLLGLLSTARGARFATIVAITDARLNKTGNPFGDVLKRSRVNVVINHNYANSVNNQRAREGNAADFVPAPRKWGTRLNGLPFVTNKGNVYLECGVQRSLGHEYVAADGQTLTDTDVAPYKREKASNADHQGVEKEIILRDYGIESIHEITVDGMHYVIDRDSVTAFIQTHATANV